MRSYVIVGNGIASATAAEKLRVEDAAADITVIASDPFPIYYRPALKDYLRGKVREDKLWVRPSTFYYERRIRFLPDEVVGIGVGQHSVQLRSGKSVAYSRLLLAHGARARSLNCPGIGLAGVATLRTIADYQKVLSRLNRVRRIVVTGSGTLALETIETLRQRGFQVTHLLRRRTLWSEVLDPVASDLILQQEKHDNVNIRAEQEIAEIIGKDGQVTGVITTTGVHIPCEMVIVAVGIDPIIDFVKRAGIACGRGVRVDDMMRTNAPDIYAAGDLIEAIDPMTGRSRLIGHWYPCIQQARAAAYSMLELLDVKHQFRFGNFFNATFLYGLDFASVGLSNIPKGSQGYQELVADPQPRTYQKVIFKDNVPVGMLALGNRSNMLAFKRAIDYSVNLAPVTSRLFAPDFRLGEWLDRQGVPGPILSVSRASVGIKKVAYAAEGSWPVTQTAQLSTVGGRAMLRELDAVNRTSTSVFSGQSMLNTDGSLSIPGTTQTVPAAMVSTLKETPTLVTIVRGNPEVLSLRAGRRFQLGRDLSNDIVLSDLSVSRKHAEAFPGSGGFYIRDLGSSNGVCVNQSKIDNPYRLSHGDRITVGNVDVYFFELGSPDALPAMKPGSSQNGVATLVDAKQKNSKPAEGAQSKTCRTCGALDNRLAHFCTSCGAPL